MALVDYEIAIRSFIHDDDKLVTYKWLSKEFEIHVNLAKDILQQYWEKNKKKEKIIATLLMIGRLDDGSVRVSVVKESDIDSAKKKFVKIDCEHLYSIQKSLPDIELLASVDEGDMRYSSIKCNPAYVRNNDEIEALRYIGNVKEEEKKATQAQTTSNKNVEKPISEKVESSPAIEQPKKQSNKKDEVKESDKSREKEKADPKPKQVKKRSPFNESSKKSFKSKKNTSKKQPIQSVQTGLKNLFGKVPSKLQTPSDKPVESQRGRKSKVKENRHSQPEEKFKKVTTKEDTTEKTSSQVQTSAIRGKKRNRSQENNTPSKRKQKINVPVTSKDESGRSDNDEEEPMLIDEESPNVMIRRSIPTEKWESGKRTVRKTIDRNYKDEDVYLMTKGLVNIHVAASNNEKTKVEVAPQTPRPVKPQTRMKQTTLIDFFKKIYTKKNQF